MQHRMAVWRDWLEIFHGIDDISLAHRQRSQLITSLVQTLSTFLLAAPWDHAQRLPQ
jgi:hypothetical protein